MQHPLIMDSMILNNYQLKLKPHLIPLNYWSLYQLYVLNMINATLVTVIINIAMCADELIHMTWNYMVLFNVLNIAFAPIICNGNDDYDIVYTADELNGNNTVILIRVTYYYYSNGHNESSTHSFHKFKFKCNIYVIINFDVYTFAIELDSNSNYDVYKTKYFILTCTLIKIT